MKKNLFVITIIFLIAFFYLPHLYAEYMELDTEIISGSKIISSLTETNTAFDTSFSSIYDATGSVESISEYPLLISYSYVRETADSLPALLTWKKDKYLLTIKPQNVQFAVTYSDTLSDPATSNPVVKAVYWNKSTPTQTNNVILTTADNSLYSKDVDLPIGEYEYKYVATNNNYPSEYALETSSCVVCLLPTKVVNVTPKDKLSVSTAKLTLKWDDSSLSSENYTYRVYLKEGLTGTWNKVYEGTGFSYDLLNLNCDTEYFWKIDSVNQYGISSTSDEFSFITIKKVTKPFNYPNPFNPNKQKTNIVFQVNDAQTVKITIYSEYGDIVYKTTYDAIPGINECQYDGKDGNGKTLYNGSYICKVETREGAKICYLLIIK